MLTFFKNNNGILQKTGGFICNLGAGYHIKMDPNFYTPYSGVSISCSHEEIPEREFGETHIYDDGAVKLDIYPDVQAISFDCKGWSPSSLGGEYIKITIAGPDKATGIIVNYQIISQPTIKFDDSTYGIIDNDIPSHFRSGIEPLRIVSIVKSE